LISQLEKEVTLRYLKTRKKDGFLNIISIFSFIGISLGVAVLIIVMSVMNGFRTELVDKIVGFNPHAVIKTYNSSIDESIFNNKDLNNLSNVFVYSNSGEGVLINKNYTKGLLLRGYLANDYKKLSIVKRTSFKGNKKLNPDYISIGKDLSFSHNIKIGDKILIMSPTGVQTIVGNLPKQKTYIVDSIFDSEISDFDQNVAFINLNDLENLFDLEISNRNLEII
jgi:ABC-type transport system, involved in lipoprotein release, permease component